MLQGIHWGYLSLLLIAATFPLPFKISNLFIGLAVLVWLASGNVIKKVQQAFRNPYLWPVVIFFFLHVVALLYTENIKAGVFVLEKKLSLLILPIVICSTKLSGKQKNNILYFFAWSIAIASLVLTGNVIYKYILEGTCDSCIHHEYTSLLGIHAIYFSYYCIFSILILSSFILKKINRKPQPILFYIQFLAIAFLLTSILFAASKTVIASFVLLLPIFIVTIASRQKLKVFIVSLTIVLSGVGAVSFLEPVQDRFLTIYNDKGFESLSIVGTSQKLDNNDKRALTGLSLRLLLGKIGLHQIAQDNQYIIGYGPGDVGDILNSVYLKHNMAPNWFYNYNVHNQYIHVFLSLGIIGLLSLCGLLTSNLVASTKRKDYLFLFFTMLTSVAFLSEVVLALNKGIVFYSYFYALFSSKEINS